MSNCCEIRASSSLSYLICITVISRTLQVLLQNDEAQNLHASSCTRPQHLHKCQQVVWKMQGEWCSRNIEKKKEKLEEHIQFCQQIIDKFYGREVIVQISSKNLLLQYFSISYLVQINKKDYIQSRPVTIFVLISQFLVQTNIARRLFAGLETQS